MVAMNVQNLGTLDPEKEIAVGKFLSLTAPHTKLYQ